MNLINKSGAAKSFSGSFPQRGLNGFKWSCDKVGMVLKRYGGIKSLVVLALLVPVVTFDSHSFCDYHNMIAILEKYEHKTDFHQIEDFVEASHLRIETIDEGTKILATVNGKSRTISETSIRRNLKLKDEAGISSLPDAKLFENLTLMGYNILPNQKFSFQKGTLTEPHHTPSPEAQQTSPTATSSPSLPPVTTTTIPTVIPTDTPQLRQYTRRARIAQSSALLTAADEPASLIGDDSQVIQHQGVLPLLLMRADLEIATLKARIKNLEDRDGGDDDPSREDATIKGRRLETGEEARIERITEKGSDDTEEMVNVLTFLDAASVLSSGVQVSVPLAVEVATVSVPPATISVPTGSDMVPTASPIFTTTTVATPYSRRKGKKKMVELETPKKKKLQEQMDVQMARQLEEEMERDAQIMNEQITRDAEIARIHAEEELQIMIDGLDRNNETVSKYLQEYHQFATDLSIEERIELINDLVKYQDNYEKVLKYQSQQRKPLSKKQQREFYMSVLKSHSCWKSNHFKEMTLEEIREKFDPVWKLIQDFVPMGSKEKGEKFKRKGLRLEQDSAKKVKSSEEVSEEDLKAMMQLVSVEEVYVEALQLWALVKETLNIRQATSDKEKELWVELKRLYEPDVED
nr:hypothetical protein [Tanacetum cinerariifolium]